MSPRPEPIVPDSLPGGRLPEDLMRLAFDQAKLAADADEAPVGAVLIGPDGDILSKAHNSPISLNDPTAHAEILCIRRAADKLGNYRLTGSIMAVTLEPCLMCVGALIHARVAGVIVGAPDPRTGALFTQINGAKLNFSNHKMWIMPNVMDTECGDLLRKFFRSRR